MTQSIPSILSFMVSSTSSVFNTVTNELNAVGFGPQLNISTATSSVGTNTGALVVTGGVGVGGSLYVGNTLTVLSNLASVGSVSQNALYVTGGVGVGQSLYVSGPAVFNNNVTFAGTTTNVFSTNTVYTDNIIELHYASSWAVNDSKDIGLRFHYYDTADRNAFLGRDNATGYLEWLVNSSPDNVNNVTGTNGTFRLGSVILTDATVSNATNTGALTVVGGAGVGGNLNVGGVITATNVYINGYAVNTSTAGTLSAQYFGTGLGTVTTLNFATGTTATLVGGVLTIQATTSSGTTFNTATLVAQAVSATSLVSGTWTFTVSSTGSVTLNGIPFVSGSGTTTASGTGTTTTFVISNATASTGTNTGALTVIGGVGIGGNLNVGGTVTGGGIRTTTTSTAPSNPIVGDIWYYTNSDVTYRYTNDGTSSYWIDITGPTYAIATNTNIILKSSVVNAAQGTLVAYNTIKAYASSGVLYIQSNAATSIQIFGQAAQYCYGNGQTASTLTATITTSVGSNPGASSPYMQRIGDTWVYNITDITYNYMYRVTAQLTGATSTTNYNIVIEQLG